MWSASVEKQLWGRAASMRRRRLYLARRLSLPLRYMHSPVETADMADVQATIDLLVEFVASLKVKDSFRYKL